MQRVTGGAENAFRPEQEATLKPALDKTQSLDSERTSPEEPKPCHEEASELASGPKYRTRVAKRICAGVQSE